MSFLIYAIAISFFIPCLSFYASGANLKQSIFSGFAGILTVALLYASAIIYTAIA